MSSPPRQHADREPPSLTTLPRPRLQLTPPPTPLTTFIGRDELVAQALALLARPEVRLLTLTGPGGVGKTRLALRLASEVTATTIEGVAFASLAPIADPALVGPAIARSLGVREPGVSDSPIGERLSVHLRDRPVLLVADNFEHVAAAAPLVAEIMSACPTLTILVTSRGRLRLSGEHELPVLPLSVPMPDAAVEEAKLAPAVALFVARATAIRPNLDLSPENVVAMAEICRRLDGLPLAIELAAGRVGVLPPRALLSRLDQRLPLLAGGPHDLPTRHQTMHAAIAWDYDLLPADHQAAFRRLSVFAGGFTLEAAESVAGGGWRVAGEDGAEGGGRGAEENSRPSALRPPPSALDLLSTLIDHHLVRQTEQSDGDVRFDQLETIREFGRDRLEAAGEQAEIQRRHAEWCLVLAEAAKPELTGSRQAAWLDRLEREHDNLRSALSWAIADGDEAELGLRLASALWRFWDVRGYGAEGRTWLERALPRGVAVAATLRAQALYAAGALSWAEPAQATLRYEAALAIWNELDRPVEAAQSLNDLGTLAWLAGDFDLAETRFRAALARAPATGEDRLVAAILHNRGTIALTRGDDAAAAARLEESAALLRPLGDAQSLAIVLDNLGTVALRQGDYARATAHHEECLTLCRRLGDRQGIGAALSNLAAVALAEDDAARAEALYGDALHHFREIDDRHLTVSALRGLAAVARTRRDDDQAAALLRQALLLCVELNNRLGIADSLEALAPILATRGRPDRAARLIGAAAALRDALGEPGSEAERSALDTTLAGARAALGPTRLAAEIVAGRALTIEAAIATASPPVGLTVPAPAAAAPAETDLTAREREVLALLVEGVGDRAIADRLSISPRTASKHVRAILDKLGVESRTAAATYAVRRGLV